LPQLWLILYIATKSPGQFLTCPLRARKSLRRYLMAKKLFVGNLSWGTTEEQLLEHLIKDYYLNTAY
jgi:hypothetical protein